MRPPPPDFAIVGAPKCGTTSVYAALKRHPQLFLPGMKEPNYFAFDFPKLRQLESARDYSRLFRTAGPDQMRGDASVHYLNSEEAIPAMLRLRPDVKVIALVRNPVEMFVSWHNELLKGLDEDEPSPQDAWDKQAARARGIDIPKLCKDPAILQYKTVCSLGAQMDRLFRLLPASQRLVIVHDDLNSEPRRVFQQIAKFLGVADDGTSLFTRENGFAQFRSRTAAMVVRSMVTSPTVKKVRAKFQPALNELGIKPMAWFVKRTLKATTKPALPRSFYEELWTSFAPDVRLLSRLLNRDLSHWQAGVDAMERARHGCRI